MPLNAQDPICVPSGVIGCSLLTSHIMKVFFISVILMALVQIASGQINYLGQGNQYLNEKKYEEAEKTFKEAIYSEPSNLVYQCQLALSLIKQSKHTEAQEVLNNLLAKDSADIGGLWYAGMNNFLDKSADLRLAISYFEKALAHLYESQSQYYSANWFIGRSYHILLQKDGLTYDETSRLIESYSTYLRLQPDAKDAGAIMEFTERVKSKRPTNNVQMWVYRTEQ